MSKSQYKIPFDTQGNLLHYPMGSVQWEENYEFEGALRFCKMKSGYSAKYTIWETEDGRQFSMFMKDVIGIIENATDVDHGLVRGRWTFQKRGQNYGVRLVG